MTSYALIGKVVGGRVVWILPKFDTFKARDEAEHGGLILLSHQDGAKTLFEVIIYRGQQNIFEISCPQLKGEGKIFKIDLEDIKSH